MKLGAHTRQLLLNRPRTLTLTEIEKLTGLKIDWLSKYANDKIKLPHVDDVQKLYEVLTKDKSRLNF